MWGSRDLFHVELDGIRWQGIVSPSNKGPGSRMRCGEGQGKNQAEAGPTLKKVGQVSRPHDSSILTYLYSSAFWGEVDKCEGQTHRQH